MKPSKQVLKNLCSSAPLVTDMDGIGNKTWKVEEIFQDIEGDPDNVTMQIPYEISQYLNLQPGDRIGVQVTESGLVITKNNK